MSLYDRVFKPKKYRLANGKEVEERFTRLPLILLILLACTVVSVQVTGFSLQVLVTGGKRFFDILFAMVPPNTKYLAKIWSPLLDTIKMSLLGSAVGAVLALPFAVLAANNVVTNRYVVMLVRLFLSLVRTLPTLVCALIATYIFGLGTMAGTCSIAVFTFAYVGKQLFELIETADMGSFEAMEALGATRTRSFLAAILPQILPTFGFPLLSGRKCPLRLHPGLCGGRWPGSYYEREDRLAGIRQRGNDSDCPVRYGGGY